MSRWMPDAIEQWSLTTFREKLIKIGAKIVRHGRYVVFQTAEVAIPHELFADILLVSIGSDRSQPWHDRRNITLQTRRQDRCAQIRGKRILSRPELVAHRSKPLAADQETPTGCTPSDSESASTRPESLHTGNHG
jgi:hypothetical protein